MWQLVGELIPFALVVAASPLPIIAALLLLAAPVGLRGGALFALARVVTLAVIVTVGALLADVLDRTAESTWPAAVLRIVLGVVLIGVAVRKWLMRPRGTDAEKLPGWMRAIDTAGAGASLRLGAIVTVANPKELAMAVGAGLALGGALLPVGPVVVAGIVFLVLGSLGATLPVLVLAVGRHRVAPALADARDWFVRNNATLIAIVLLAIGGLLVGGGIGKLG